ncbi:MAG TPA: cation diffusion facilitator family transporter [Rhodanobacteraceae bacterium]|nr:cation diffusion facilitator family transporter [Rhodanobacteraceae bacterium]
MHAHDHSDEHAHNGSSHQGHSHGVSRNADKRWLTLALALLLAFMVAEVLVGIMARSLALISDAGHMLTDVGSIALALFAIRMATRPARGRYTFGFKRVEILSAQANGLTLLVLAAWFVYEAIRRLIAPPPVQGSLMTLVAVAGIVINLAVVWIMGKANRQSLNIQGSYAHLLNDLYAFIATAVAGAIIWLTGWDRADAIAALVVAALMLKAGLELVRDSGRIFLEASPKNLDPAAVRASILATPGVTGINDLHIWEVTSGFPALAAHVFVRPEDDCHDKRRELEVMLRNSYHIEHATLQMDHARDTAALVTGCKHDAV